jgi:hypothetical protein
MPVVDFGNPHRAKTALVVHLATSLYSAKNFSTDLFAAKGKDNKRR